MIEGDVARDLRRRIGQEMGVEGITGLYSAPPVRGVVRTRSACGRARGVRRLAPASHVTSARPAAPSRATSRYTVTVGASRTRRERQGGHPRAVLAGRRLADPAPRTRSAGGSPPPRARSVRRRVVTPGLSHSRSLRARTASPVSRPGGGRISGRARRAAHRCGWPVGEDRTRSHPARDVRTRRGSLVGWLRDEPGRGGPRRPRAGRWPWYPARTGRANGFATTLRPARIVNTSARSSSAIAARRPSAIAWS